MSLAADCARYGIDSTDKRYDTTFFTGNRPPYCFCGNHSEREPRANCDLQARRAWAMNDPVWCPYCQKVFERIVTDASPESQVGCCPTHKPKPTSGKRRRGGLSAARARKVFLSDHHRSLSQYSPAELNREAYDEVEDR